MAPSNEYSIGDERAQCSALGMSALKRIPDSSQTLRHFRKVQTAEVAVAAYSIKSLAAREVRRVIPEVLLYEDHRKTSEFAIGGGLPSIQKCENRVRV